LILVDRSKISIAGIAYHQLHSGRQQEFSIAGSSYHQVRLTQGFDPYSLTFNNKKRN
jgi:hypothetical protein